MNALRRFCFRRPVFEEMSVNHFYSQMNLNMLYTVYLLSHLYFGINIIQRSDNGLIDVGIVWRQTSDNGTKNNNIASVRD